MKTSLPTTGTNPESLERDIAARVLGAKPSAYCDACLALAVKAALDETRQTAVRLALGVGFERKVQACLQCGRTLEITSAK